MNDGYHALGSALSSVIQRLDIAALNTVNARTPGYQRYSMRTRSFETEMDREMDRSAALVRSESKTAWRQGTFIQREDPLAIALKGPGLFAVETESGEAWTRNGDLRLDAQGTLRTQGGYAVLGNNGPIKVTLVDGPVSISTDGSVNQGGVQRGLMKLRDFPNKADLERAGDSLFLAKKGAKSGPVTETTVHSGFLEIAQGGTVTGMVEMIAAGREFEAAQRVATVMDGTYERLNRG